MTEIHITHGKPVCPHCGSVLHGIVTATYVHVPLYMPAGELEYDANDGQLNDDYLDALDCARCQQSYEIDQVTLVFD